MRGLRLLRDGARYHVSARANRQEFLLDPKSAKLLFLGVLAEARKCYRFKVEDFCIMGNHFHLIIKPASGESLSMIMKWILQVFAIRYNRRHGLTGHFWGDRFFSRIIEGREEFRRLFEYINRNPCEAGLCRSPLAWPFCGLWHFLHRRSEILGRILPNWLKELYESAVLEFS